MHDDRRQLALGTTLAVVSAASFGFAGPMGKALIEAGWTSGAAVLLRIGGASVLLVLLAWLRHRTWRPDAKAIRVLVLYGLIAMAGIQLAFFNAVSRLDVGVALLIEYLAPVLLLAYAAVRARLLPPRATLAGAAFTLVGLVLVLDLTGVSGVDPIGVAWALAAALCLAGYFALSDGAGGADLPPLVMAAGGTVVGAAALGLAGLVGVVPMTAVVTDVELAGRTVGWWVPGLALVLVATFLAYATGITGVRLLGARTGSFLSLLEVLFAIVAAWLLLAELPRPIQLVGGALILVGIVIIRREGAPALRRPALRVAAADGGDHDRASGAD